MPSMVSYSARSLAAVFSPTEGMPGDVIHRIAHEAKHVYDLIHPLNPQAVAELLNPEHFRRITPRGPA